MRKSVDRGGCSCMNKEKLYTKKESNNLSEKYINNNNNSTCNTYVSSCLSISSSSNNTSVKSSRAMSSNMVKLPTSCTKGGGGGVNNNQNIHNVYTHDHYINANNTSNAAAISEEISGVPQGYISATNAYYLTLGAEKDERVCINNNNNNNNNQHMHIPVQIGGIGASGMGKIIEKKCETTSNFIQSIDLPTSTFSHTHHHNIHTHLQNACVELSRGEKRVLKDSNINQTNVIENRRNIITAPGERNIIDEKISDINIKNLTKTSISNQSRTYDFGRILGNGSFGVVCEARCLETGEQVAIKKVLQDPRYKNRELDIMHELHHPNVVELKDYFYTEIVEDVRVNDNKEKNECNDRVLHQRNNALSSSSGSSTCLNRYLNVVMEHIPDTVHRVMKTFVKNSQPMPFLLIKLYAYQMCRSLGYLHSLGICHRDIKPQNLLVDSKTHVLKLCDFGSAKKLIPGEQSVAYICSRFYRAPELMLGCTEYTTAIDIWSIGCVLGELLLGRPLFAGDTSVDQLVKIIQVLGTPTQKQMIAMNPNYTDFRFPEVKSRDWKKIFGITEGDDEHASAVELLSQFLRYVPSERLRPLDALAHDFFDELRDPATRLPGGGSLPDLFSFGKEELMNISPEAIQKVIPFYMHQ